MKIARLITYISSIKGKLKGLFYFANLQVNVIFANSSIGWNSSNDSLAHAEQCDTIGGKQMPGRVNP